MTLEQFKEKYKFEKNMDEKDIRNLMLFITMLLLKISIGGKDDDDEEGVEAFLEDAKDIMRKKSH